MRRHCVFNALLLTGALALTVYLIVRFGVILILIQTVWKWVATLGYWLWYFVQQVTLRIITRKAMNPLWRAIGLTALITYIIGLAKRYAGPLVSRWIRYLRQWWRDCPWHIKVASVLACVITAVFFGLGLWLIPLGVPFYTKIVTKLKVKLANSWLKRKSRGLQVWWRCFLRSRRDVTCIRWTRATRYWLIRRERKTTAWAEARIGGAVARATG